MTPMLLPLHRSIPAGLSGALAVLFLSLVLGACTLISSGTLEAKQAKSVSIPPGQTVALSVKAAIGDESDPAVKKKADEAVLHVRTELSGRLMGDSVFGVVARPGEAADYRMDVIVKGSRKISWIVRFVFRELAGWNSLYLSVALYEADSNKLVTEFDASGRSASYKRSNEATYQDAVREAVDQIVGALR